MTRRKKEAQAAMERYRQSIDYYPFFVYGTLRSGMGNYHNYLRGMVEKEIPATVQGLLYHKGGLPVAIEGEGKVVGELMYVKPELYGHVAHNLDMLEGYRGYNSDWNHYNRKLVDVTTESGEVVKAWMYYYNNEVNGMRGARLLPSGDYVKYFKSTRSKWARW